MPKVERNFSKAKGPAKRNPVLRTWLDDAIVDAFAGGGGASSGIEDATGRSPDVAINHDPEAIAMHAINHPKTKHYISNVWDVDPRVACAGRRVGIMWLSPTCTFFSKARGGPLSSDTIKIRALCWLAIRWAAAVKPRLILCENVVEFEKYGPVHRVHTNGCTGKATCRKTCRYLRPIKAREGETFHAFIEKLRVYYKHVEWRQLRACDFGAPTTRLRFFLQASNEPIRWPVPSHGPGRALPYRTAAECIDWSIEGQSIFDRPRSLADKTLARIARGIHKFVLNNPRPFLVPSAYGDKGGRDVRVNSIDAPMPTVCGNRGGHQIVAPIFMKAKTYGGGGNEARAANEPLNTITASKRGEHVVASATLFRVDHGDVDSTGKKRGQGTPGLEEPLPTVCAGGQAFAIAETKLAPVSALGAAYLVHRGNGERPGQTPRTYDVAEPLRTVVAEGEKFAACIAMLIKHNGGNNDAHGSSGQTVDRPIDTIVGKNNKAVTVAHLVRYNSENSAGSARGQSLDEPTSTLDTSNRLGLVASHLVKMRGTSAAHVDSSSSDMEAPTPTISAGGMHLARVDAELAPAGELTERARRVAAFLIRYNGQSLGQEMETPIGTLDTTDRYGLITVMIAGEEYVIVDIKMRMLEPRELFRAQGFGEGYTIAPTWNGKPLTKTAQIRMCGNSVAPPVAAAIVRAALGIDGSVEEVRAA